MHIESIKIENFRLLKNCRLDVREKTTLLVGKNNTGKTSFAVVLEKFLERTSEFTYHDFPLSCRQDLKNINPETDLTDVTIRLVLRIKYDENDDLSVLSEFMLDLDPVRRHTNILFECTVNKEKLLRALPDKEDERHRFIENNLGKKFLTTKVFAFDDFAYEGDEPYYIAKRDQLEEKDKNLISGLCNLQVIHARRNVASSEDSGRGAKPLSSMSTKFFKKLGELAASKEEAVSSEGDSVNTQIDKLREMLAGIDTDLEDQYDAVFGTFLESSRDFLDLGNLKVISNLQSQTLIENYSQVIYGDNDNYLPEQFSGLGYLNVLFLLLQIELCREDFQRRGAPINLLLMEEPEAHTHPQMQYVFADKIHTLVSQIPSLQAILTTHSSHIVSKSDFEDIRYLSKHGDTDPVEIKNFHADLLEKYRKLGADGSKLFQFLQQYLTINSAELFFANKAIFIEGTTERILLPWFIKKHDDKKKAAEDREEKGDKKNEGQAVPFDRGLSSQNITVLEVGANARAFGPFMEFIGVRTLVITDIDTTKPEKNECTGKTSYRACAPSGSSHTSNETLKGFFRAPKDPNSEEYKAWHAKLLSGQLCKDEDNVKVVYQLEEDGYHARSFEDAFLSINYDRIFKNKAKLDGLKSVNLLQEKRDTDFYALTDKVLNKKSDFAGSILFSALVEGEDWSVPDYIMKGLEWVCKD
ncbi:ATP-dependent endonuclease [Roseovarius sp. D22-M7]|uniref:ATP-dependent endonuclease n=1 Tax=Roseovarius sp. D22-M7 TaxID=3127116 RepID=UPI00300F9DBC